MDCGQVYSSFLHIWRHFLIWIGYLPLKNTLFDKKPLHVEMRKALVAQGAG